MQAQSFCLVALALFIIFHISMGESRRTRDGTIRVGLRKHHKLGERTLNNYQEHVHSLRSLTTKGQVSLRDVKDMYYYAQIGVGTPNQTINVDFDTGSSDLWVPSSLYCLYHKEYCRSHDTYSHKNSKTFTKTGGSFSISYGSGQVSGFVSQDNINVAGMTVKGQLFGEATHIDPDTASDLFDGIFGLAYKSLSEIKTDPPFVNMVKQHLVSEAVFAFYLNKDNSSSEGVGELVLGGVDPNHYSGDIRYTPVTEKNYWMITLDRLSCSDQTISFKQKAILDSGTSLILGPWPVIYRINKIIGGKEDHGIYIVDCDKISGLPEVNFEINGDPFILQPEDYILKVKDDSGKITCISSFVGMRGLEFVIMGDVFIRQYYTVFDMGKDRIGLTYSK